MAALILALLMTGFTVGWTLAVRDEWAMAGGGRIEEASRPKQPLLAEKVAVPAQDVPGKDISGLPRYPGSVRVSYAREDLEGVVWIEARYVTSTEPDAVREFYRDVFRSEGWEVGT